MTCWGEGGVRNPTPGRRYGTLASAECAIGGAGELTCWFEAGDPRAHVPPGRYVAASTSSAYACALTEAGEMACWGDGFRIGEWSGGPRDGPWAAISVGYFPGGGVAANVCALDTDGEARCWGSNYSGQSEAPPGRYTAVSTSGVHACALTDGGAIACWGRGRAADAPTGRYTALSVRSDHSARSPPLAARSAGAACSRA